MKKITLGLFSSRDQAEEAINKLHRNLKIDTNEISYVYRNEAGDLREVDADEVSTDTPGEAAGKGAWIGAAVGGLAGLAALSGTLPMIGTVVVAGPILAALGITGTIATGIATGAVAGSLIGALAGWGVRERRARQYADRVRAGDILVAVHADAQKDPKRTLVECGAMDVGSYALTV